MQPLFRNRSDNKSRKSRQNRRRRGMILETLESRQLLAAVTQALPGFEALSPSGSQVHR